MKEFFDNDIMNLSALGSNKLDLSSAVTRHLDDVAAPKEKLLMQSFVCREDNAVRISI